MLPSGCFGTQKGEKPAFLPGSRPQSSVFSLIWGRSTPLMLPFASGGTQAASFGSVMDSIPAQFSSSRRDQGLPWWLRQLCLQCGIPGLVPWIREIPQRRNWQPTPVFLPGKPHGWRNLTGYSPWGHKELDTTERPHLLSFFLRRGQSLGKSSNPY